VLPESVIDLRRISLTNLYSSRPFRESLCVGRGLAESDCRITRPVQTKSTIRGWLVVLEGNSLNRVPKAPTVHKSLISRVGSTEARTLFRRHALKGHDEER
jgi:hypothetical protein